MSVTPENFSVRRTCGPRVDIRAGAIGCGATIPRMPTLLNYSLLFGVVLRAVCPTTAGLDD
jgi:hypothetical protein